MLASFSAGVASISTVPAKGAGRSPDSQISAGARRNRVNEWELCALWRQHREISRHDQLIRAQFFEAVQAQQAHSGVDFPCQDANGMRHTGLPGERGRIVERAADEHEICA